MKKLLSILRKHKITTAVVAAILVAAIVLSCLGALVFTRFSEGVVPTEEDLTRAVVYDRVVLIGVDGAGSWFERCDTPAFDRIFAAGSVTYEGWSQYPTISAENWTSMLHGVRCQKHGVNNKKADARPYTDERYPSVFKIYAERHPEAQFYAACSWAPINKGIIEDLPAVTKVSGGPIEGDTYETMADGVVMDAVLTQLADPAFDPKIMFIHLDEVDGYGHHYGSNAAQYRDAIETVDVYIGQIYDACCARGWRDDTLYMVVSDHGHRITTGHGTNTKREWEVTVAVTGNLGNIRAGKPGKVVTQDVASIVLYALGEKQPEGFDGRVPYGMFTTIG